ncbi:uncharacterized protein LOC142741521 isoform X2 [Rhinoderma darwinii]
MMQDPERSLSAWTCSKDALREQNAGSLFQELAEQKRKEREKDPEVKRMKKKYRLKAPTYPSPGNVLHTGRQLVRTPGPGVLALLPSQKFEPSTGDDEGSFRVHDNMVPCGHQLARTPTRVNVLREIQVNEKVGPFKSTEKSECDGKHEAEREVRSKRNDENYAVSRGSDAMPDLENVPSGGKRMTTPKELKSESVEAFSKPTIQNKRISQMPVQGLNQMRISGVLKKMVGYECRNEDLEFLKSMENQEKAKVLKKELLCLRKAITATNQEKELVLAKKEKIEDDIEKMKRSFDRTVQLGRALLSRTRDLSSVGDLTPDDLLKQLNSMSIQSLHQQVRHQLAAAEKELHRRQHEAANRTSPAENPRRSLTLKVKSSEQHLKEVQCRIQQLKEEVITLKTQINRTEDNKSELEASVQKKRLQVTYSLKHVKQNSEMSDEDKDQMNRSLQRILHRKDNYLERERILQRLKKDLQ